MVFYHARMKDEEELERPVKDPLMRQTITPSMRAVKKYLWVVSVLILIQVTFGVITAHYGVEGDAFYGLDLAEILPYSISRTWHVQLGILWIATAWLGTGLIYCTCSFRKGSKVSDIWRELSFRLSVSNCSWFYGRTMDGSDAKTGTGRELLVWSPGL